MIGLVLVTHGGLAAELIAAMEHVVGPQTHVKGICIGPDDDMDARRKEILEAAKAVNLGDGVILLTDMFGGTPSNLAISVMDKAPPMGPSLFQRASGSRLRRRAAPAPRSSAS